jgi:CRP/FNR family transcriptional regulator
MLLIAHDAACAPPLPAIRQADEPATTTLLLRPRENLTFGNGSGAVYYRLKDGCIALSRFLPDGRRQICDIVGPGRLFGFSLQGPGQCGAESLTFSTVERYGRRAAAEARAEDIARMLNRQQNHALLLGRKTAAERVATALVDLAAQFGRGPANGGTNRPRFTLFPTRGDLADWLGLTVETVSRCLHRFRREKLIDFNRPECVRILDLAALERLSGATA